MARRPGRLLLLLALVTGCSGATPVAGPTPPPSPPSPSSPAGAGPASSGPVSSAPVTTARPATPTASPAGGCPTVVPGPVPFAATTSPSSRPATGGPLGVRGATTGVHPGYDRVVITLAGRAAGTPGWRVAYVARPTSDASGRPVAVRGASFLQVTVTGVGYPQDTGVPGPAVTRLTPRCTRVVRQVVLDGVFEGSYTAFVGLSRVRPFRVFGLAHPARVVVDVRHG